MWVNNNMRKDEITVRARKNLKEFLLGAELGCYWWRMQHKKKFEVLKVLSREKNLSYQKLQSKFP